MAGMFNINIKCTYKLIFLNIFINVLTELVYEGTFKRPFKNPNGCRSNKVCNICAIEFSSNALYKVHIEKHVVDIILPEANWNVV